MPIAFGRNLLLFFAIVLFAYAEPSVYSFGSSNGYSTEENSQKMIALKREIAQLHERIEGLTTVVEGLSAAVNELRQHQNLSSGDTDRNKDYANKLKELGDVIDHINASYVTKEELHKMLVTKHLLAKKPNTPLAANQKSEEVLESKTASKLYSEGVRLFQKKRYDHAKKRFVITDSRGYKPAASNYYLGEIAYYTRHYDDAIFYFKKSAGLYDRASYIDVLLLHTAIALEKTGDKKQAKRFYENIVANYPRKRAAKIAKEKLRRLDK